MRRLLLLMVLLLALVVAPTAAFAQDELPIACGNLSDEDCDFLKASREAVQGLASYDAEVSVDVALSNVPSLPAELGFTLDSFASFALDPEINQRMLEIQMASGGDIMANFEELMAASVDFYSQSAFDLELEVGLSEDIAALVSSQAGMVLPDALSFAMRLVDGNVYFNADTLGMLAGDPSITGWIGVDMVGMLEQSMDAAVEQLESGMMDDAGVSALLGATGSNMMMAQQFVDYVDVERLDDSEVDGVAVAEFLYTFDLAGFASSPEFTDMLVTQVQQQIVMQEAMGQEAPVSESDLAMVTDMLPMLAPMLLSGVQWETVASIGLEDGYVYETETTVDWDLGSLAAMAGSLMGGEGASMAAGAENARFSMSSFASNSGFNEEKDIVAPEDAIMVPLDGMTMSEM